MMKINKKILSIFSAVALTASLFSTVAFADDGLGMKVSSEPVKAGETATVKIDITENPGLISCVFYARFDDSFTVTKADLSSCVLLDANSELNTSVEQNKSYYMLSWSDKTGDIAHSDVGTFATLEVNVPEGTKPGDYPISIEPIDVWDIAFNDLVPTLDPVEPKITVVGEQKDPTITLDPSPLTFKYGETKTITATTTNFDGTVAWEVIEGSDVISIDPNNTTCGVKALKVGTAKIQASAGNAKETVEVKVNAAVKDDTIVLPSEKNVKILDIKLVDATNHGQHIFISKNGADEKQSEKTIGEILRGEWIDGTSVEGSIAIGVITDNAADVFTFDFR